jgi:hypothetical protein
MTQETLGQRLTTLRTDALALLQDVSRDSETPHGGHANLISSLQQVANHLGAAQALSSR